MNDAVEREILSGAGMEGLRYIPFAGDAKEVMKSTTRRTATLLTTEETVGLGGRTFRELSEWADGLGAVVESEDESVSILVPSLRRGGSLVTFRDISSGDQTRAVVRVAVLRPMLRRNHRERKIARDLMAKLKVEFVK